MRRRILDAAKQLFVKEGFENVSLRRIAGKIQYSPAAIYRYFKNKREILSVLREEGFARYVARQERGMKAYPDPVERLRIGGKRYIEFSHQEPDYYQLMFSTDCTQVDLDGEWAVSSRIAYTIFRSTVEECITKGHFGSADLDTAVFSLWSGVHGMAHLIATGQADMLSGGFNFDTLLDTMIAFWMRPGSS